MKNITIKIKDIHNAAVIKETPEQRLERVRDPRSAMFTKVMENKKKYNRKKLKPISFD